MQGPKIVQAVHYDAPMSMQTAEHQKVQVSSTGEQVTFSSPFGFSGGEGTQASPATGSMGYAAVQQSTVQQVTMHQTPMVPAASMVLILQQLGPPPAHVEGCFGIWHVNEPPRSPRAMQQEMPKSPRGLPPPEPVIEGFLMKRGHEFGKSWLKRWFCLMPGGLLTYGKCQKTRTEKTVPLLPHTAVRALISPEVTKEGSIMGTKKPCGFEIFSGGEHRTWFIDAESPEKLKAWLWCLNRGVHEARVISQSQGHGPMLVPPSYTGKPMW